MLSSITEPPRMITLEEWSSMTSETPSSFASIPPILRHKQEQVTVAFSPDWQGYSDAGVKGTLFVTEEALSFLPSEPSSSSPGFTLSYPIITLHAISRDNADMGPCVYCQLDESDPAAAPPPPVERENDGHYHPEDEHEEDTPMRELRIFVGEEHLEPIFLSLSHCASLHPSQFDTVDGMSDDEGIYSNDFNPATFVPFTGEDGEELSAVGRAALAHLESIIVWPTPAPTDDASAEAVEDAPETDEPETKKADEPTINGKA